MTNQTKICLLVDDDPAILEMVGEGLRMNGFTVIKAKHPPQALSEIRSVQLTHALIDFDLGWPEMNGVDLIQEIQRDFPDIPIVLMTGFQNIGVAVEATRSEGVEHLIKPFRIDQVLSAFERRKEIVELRQDNRRLRQENEDLKQKINQHEQQLSEMNSRTESVKKHLPFELNAAQSYARQQKRTMPDEQQEGEVLP